jgi:hypothetical protein
MRGVSLKLSLPHPGAGTFRAVGRASRAEDEPRAGLAKPVTSVT